MQGTMDWQMLERSPRVGAMMMRLHDTHTRHKMAHHQDPMARSELAGVMVDLLNLNLTPMEGELVTDVLMALIRQAERDLRVAVSQRLSAMDNIPFRMVLHLANDEIDIAGPVLAKSPVLQDMDLIYIIKAHGPGHWQAIASRNAPGGAVVDALADTKDIRTAIVLSENGTVTLTPRALDIFAGIAEGVEDLALPLLMRSDLPKDLASRLYAAVGEELKAHIRRAYPEYGTAAEKVVSDIVLEFQEAERAEYVVAPALLTLAQDMKAKGRLTLSTMMSALRLGQVSTFMAQFSVFCAVPADTVRGMIKQKCGQGLAIACRAVDVPRSEFISLFLLTRKIPNGGDKIVDHSELSTALRYFDGVTPARAREVLAKTLS